jgi:hypothetical protein
MPTEADLARIIALVGWFHLPPTPNLTFNFFYSVKVEHHKNTSLILHNITLLNLMTLLWFNHLLN